MNYEIWLILLSSLLLIAAITSKFASKWGVSSLLITLCIGLLFGNGNSYDFYFDFPDTTLKITELALCVIIFYGGFKSDWKDTKTFFLQGTLLASVGVIITTAIIGIFIHYSFSWPLTNSLLLGAIISSTDAAAVFSILGSSKLQVSKGTNTILSVESGTNDPFAYFLTLFFVSILVQPNINISNSILLLIANILIGGLIGFLAAKLIVKINHYFSFKVGQVPVILLALIVLLFSLNKVLLGSPFLSMYIFGIVLGNSNWKNRNVNRNFYESFSWLMEVSLFLILGLQVFLDSLYDSLLIGILISLVLIFVARPIATMICLSPFTKIKLKDKIFICWVGLKGATPIVFALVALVSDVPYANEMFNISFVVVISSILIQGQSINLLGKLLKIAK